MKIAVTGGTGFVGRNIARALAGEGHEVALIARETATQHSHTHRVFFDAVRSL
jgi:uncharacterized protein YbjT (DUF2867 family)